MCKFEIWDLEIRITNFGFQNLKIQNSDWMFRIIRRIRIYVSHRYYFQRDARKTWEQKTRRMTFRSLKSIFSRKTLRTRFETVPPRIVCRLNFKLTYTVAPVHRKHRARGQGETARRILKRVSPNSRTLPFPR